MSEIFFPDYDKSILSLSNSILKSYGVKTEYKTLENLDKILAKNYKNVILMIFDALGDNILKYHLKEDDFLRKNKVDTISSVFLPTTVAATNTIYSGLPPISHGWLGWMCYVKEHDKVLELFRNTDFYTKERVYAYLPSDFLKYETIYEKISKATRRKVKTHEIFPDFKEDGVKSIEEMALRIKEIIVNKERNFILSYWNNPDHLMHEIGPFEDEVGRVIKEINKMVEELSKDVKDTLIIVTADHGQVKLEEEIYINDYPEILTFLNKPISLDDRTIGVFIKPDKKEEFKDKFLSLFGSDFVIFSKEEILAKNLFGKGEVHPKSLDFIGDFVISAKGDKSFRQFLDGFPKKDVLKGSHGGITKDEMLVPLILIER